MEEKKDVVKYRNEFNLTNINVMDKIEMDILFAICSKITENKVMEVELTFKQLEEKAFLTARDYSTIKSLKKIKSLADKITNIKFVIDKQHSFDMMPLFARFYASEEDEKIYVKLNSEFARYLFDIPEKIGFSRFELEQFIFLKSKYAKTLFRFLLQNYKGKWIVGFNDFKAIMDFPKSYGNGRVLDYTKKLFPEIESTGYFSDIEIDVTTFNKQGRPIKDVIFSYKINKEKALESRGQMRLDYEPVIEQKEKMTTQVVDTPGELPHIETKKETYTEEKKCPKCGSKVIQRRVSDKRKESFGKLYEKCEKNDKDNQQCKYFKWLDEE